MKNIIASIILIAISLVSYGYTQHNIKIVFIDVDNVEINSVEYESHYFDDVTAQIYNMDIPYNAANLEVYFDDTPTEIIKINNEFINFVDILDILYHNNLTSISYKVGNVIWVLEFYNNTISISNEVLEVSDMNVYPNPVMNIMNVEFETSNVNSLIEVYSVSGELIFVNDDYRNFGSNKVSVDMSSLPKGMYIVKLGNEVKKVIR